MLVLHVSSQFHAISTHFPPSLSPSLTLSPSLPLSSSLSLAPPLPPLLHTVPASEAENITMVNPQITMLGDGAACVCYVRLNQTINKYDFVCVCACVCDCSISLFPSLTHCLPPSLPPHLSLTVDLVFSLPLNVRRPGFGRRRGWPGNVFMCTRLRSCVSIPAIQQRREHLRVIALYFYSIVFYNIRFCFYFCVYILFEYFLYCALTTP